MSQCLNIPLLQIKSVEQDAALGGVVQACEQFDQGGFSGAIFTDQCQALSGRDLQIDVAQRILFRARVPERYVLELQSAPGLWSFGRCAAARWHGLFQVLVQVREIEIILVHTAYRRQDRRYGRLSLAKQHQVHGHRAECDGACNGRHDNPDIGAVQRPGRQQPEHESPTVPAQRQAAIFDEQFLEYVSIALQ